jgi:hypothetical protein
MSAPGIFEGIPRKTPPELSHFAVGDTNVDTGGEFVTHTQAATCRAANREQRVRETGAPAHQSSIQPDHVERPRRQHMVQVDFRLTDVSAAS